MVHVNHNISISKIINEAKLNLKQNCLNQGHKQTIILLAINLEYFPILSKMLKEYITSYIEPPAELKLEDINTNWDTKAK